MNLTEKNRVTLIGIFGQDPEKNKTKTETGEKSNPLNNGH